MLRFLIGLFVILHGMVHLWYFTLSQWLVEFKPEMVGQAGHGSYPTFLEIQLLDP